MNEKSLPKYLQLKEEILSWIHTGRLKPGDQIPSENEISEQFQMSRQTVRQTFGLLEKEGLLLRVQGKGTFVSESIAGRSAEVQTIGMLTTYISDYIFPHIVRGTESALRSRGYRLVLSSTDNDKQREKESLSVMMNEPISGLIIEPTKSAEGNPNLGFYLSLDVQQIPYIMINASYPELHCPSLKVDDEAGGYMAAEHLIQLGHKRIAGFFKTDDLQGVNRLKGFIKAHQHYRIPLHPALVVHYRTEEKHTKPMEETARILGSDDGRPTAFVCYNDELAVQLLDPIRQFGLLVPDDISLVGFDDSPLATAMEVKLTTLTHPKSEMGAAAAELLISMIEKGLDGFTAENKIFSPELIIRESTKKP
jgi:GntR family transcriptional regulator, arabinose operon transcriptional repressor